MVYKSVVYTVVYVGILFRGLRGAWTRAWGGRKSWISLVSSLDFSRVSSLDSTLDSLSSWVSFRCLFHSKPMLSSCSILSRSSFLVECFRLWLYVQSYSESLWDYKQQVSVCASDLFKLCPRNIPAWQLNVHNAQWIFSALQTSRSKETSAGLRDQKSSLNASHSQGDVIAHIHC